MLFSAPPAGGLTKPRGINGQENFLSRKILKTIEKISIFLLVVVGAVGLAERRPVEAARSAVRRRSGCSPENSATKKVFLFFLLLVSRPARPGPGGSDLGWSGDAGLMPG